MLTILSRLARHLIPKRETVRSNPIRWALPCLENLEDRSVPAQITVTGRVRWVTGNIFHPVSHPVPLASVVLTEVRPDHQQVRLLTTRTDLDGNYSPTINITELWSGPVKIYATIYASSPYSAVKSSLASRPYFVTSAVVPVNFVNHSAKILVNIGWGEGATYRAFSVHSAIVQAGRYSDSIAGTHPAAIPVVLNSAVRTTQFLFGRQNVIECKQGNGLDWDVVQHEYAHYFSKTFGFATSANTRNHYFLGHQAGDVAGAFCEGFADYFPLVAQQMDASRSYARNIPFVGDSKYTSQDPASSFTIDIATRKGLGEDNELSVASFLYHLAKGDQEIKISDREIYTKLRSNHVTTVGKAWGVFASALSVERKANLGRMLARANIAPLTYSPLNGEALGIAPTFKWYRNGAGTPDAYGRISYYLNDFVVHFYTSDYQTIATLPVPASVVGNKSTVAFTPTASQWSAISKDRTSIRWVVEGKNTQHSPRTPGGTVDRYWSQAQSIGLSWGALVQVMNPTNSPVNAGWFVTLPELRGFIAFLQVAPSVQISDIHVTVSWGDGQTTTDSSIYRISPTSTRIGVFNDHKYTETGGHTIHATIHVDGFSTATDAEFTTTCYVF